MNPGVHFEMPAEDKNRMADSYTKAFGWKTQMLGPEMNEYVLVTTTEPDVNGRPKTREPSTVAFTRNPLMAGAVSVRRNGCG